MPAKAPEETASAIVNFTSTPIDILILGAGRGGLAILEVLQHYGWVNICSIVDIDPQAPGLLAARELGIPASSDYEKAVDRFDDGIIIDVTGDKSLPERMKEAMCHRSVELVSGKSARLLYDLVHEHLRNQETIRTQGTRLDLLDSMLDVTMLLEQRPQLSELAHRSFTGLFNHVQAIRGLALIFDSDEAATIIGAIGIKRRFCDAASSRLIHSLCGTLADEERFSLLAQPIEIDPSLPDQGFNVIVPVRSGYDLAGALLFNVTGPLTAEQKTALNMASVHLNMTAKTLHHFKQLETMAIVDGLTCMFNRRYLDQKLKEEVHRIRRRAKGTLTCAFIDIDDFKLINDRYGHQIGDKALKRVAENITHCIRDYDICARYGGDEFIILLPSGNREEHQYTEQLGLRLLKQISEIRVAGAESLNLSASIGMATQSAETLNEESLLNMADSALYQAKEAGKCCMRVYSDKQFHLDYPA